jgi:hypothetical protein
MTLAAEIDLKALEEKQVLADAMPKAMQRLDNIDKDLMAPKVKTPPPIKETLNSKP